MTASTRKNPHGHRVFGVANGVVSDLIVRAIKETGLEPSHQFVSGATSQTVFSDGTVVNFLDRSNSAVETLPSSAMSLPVPSPVDAARKLVDGLHQLGYIEAFAVEPIPTLPQGSFVIVVSKALEGWVMAFRSPEIDQVEERIKQPAE